MLSEYYRLLNEFIGYKTLSTDDSFFDEMSKACDWLDNLFRLNNFDVSVIEGFSNPIVLASYHISDNKPTVLIYGHYDVQPADDFDKRDNGDPFSLHISNDKIMGRGVVDNKGQILTHMLSVFELINTGKLNYNVKFLIEGGEEIGSINIDKFIDKYKEDLNSDFVLISDGEILQDYPCIEAGFRGGFNCSLNIRTADTDLHSGLFGGIVPNASLEISKLINKLYDLNGNITIPYFYYNVDEVPLEVSIKNKKIGFDIEKFTSQTGVKEILKDKNFDLYSMVGLRPTIQVTGIESGYNGDGYKSAIPYKASVKFNFRLVNNQDSNKIKESFKLWIDSVLPKFINYDLTFGESMEAVKLDLDNICVEKVKSILEGVYGNEVYYKYSGGSLPVVSLLQDKLEILCIMVPLANEDCNMHGTNENFDIELIKKGFEFSKKFLSS